MDTHGNYMYGIIASIDILIMSRSWAVLPFINVGFVQMRARAWKKEKR